MLTIMLSITGSMTGTITIPMAETKRFMNQTGNRPTIKQVASIAGVSTQVVSRVINDRPDVAPETRERVKKVITEIGYYPSALARSLIQKRSYTLGVVTAGLKFIGPSRTLNGITFAAEKAGYSLILKELPNFSSDDVVPILKGLLSRQVDGIIWAAPEIGDNHAWVDNFSYELNVPIVFLTMEKREGKSIIAMDNRVGGRLATAHLLEKGYRHIGHIAGPLDWWEARQRFQAWKTTMKSAGTEVLENHWTEGNWSSVSGYAAANVLFDQYPEMDALFAANDQMALGALAVIHQRGLKVPQDFGIVGIDDMPESEYFWPALTSIHYDQQQIGISAVEEIIRIIESIQNNETPEHRTIMLTPDIIIRKSSLK